MFELLWIMAGGALVGLLATTAYLLRRLRSWQGRADAAEALLRRGEASLAQDLAGSALEEASQLLPESYPLIPRLVALRGRIRLALKAPVPAEADLKRALRLLEDGPSGNLTPALVLGDLAAALRAQGRVLEAAEVADQALQAATRLLAGDDERLGALHAILGGCLLATGAPDRAEPHLRRAEEVLGLESPADALRHQLQRDLARLTDLQATRLPTRLVQEGRDQHIH